MNVFLAGTEVSLVVPLTDRHGNPLTVTSVEYRIVDQAGLELVARAPLTGFVAESAEATVVVPAGVNVIAPGAIQEARNVELYCLVAGNTVILNSAYAIEVADPLVVGVNSFQTFARAQMTALGMAGVPGWMASDDRQRMGALIEARAAICQLRFSMPTSVGMDNVDFVPEGSTPTPYVGMRFSGDIAALTPEQFAALPEQFIEALRQAQVAQADALLGGDPMDVKRREGLMLESIGEVKQMFRSSKPLDLPVCKRAMRYLSRYVRFSKMLGRA